MKERTLCATAYLSLIVCILIMAAGCETSSSGNDSDLKISPASVSFTAGTETNIVFSATGGTATYSWNISDSSLGTITVSGGTAIYTSTTNQGQNFVTLTDAVSNSVAAVVNQN